MKIETVEQLVFSNKFFYGETVRHKGNNKFYTICDLSNADNDYYGMWPLGINCALPTHGSHSNNLESIATIV